jgi:hypothetical protein
MGPIRPKIVSELMDVANKFADGEDTCHNIERDHPRMTDPIITTTINIGLTIITATAHTAK